MKYFYFLKCGVDGGVDFGPVMPDSYRLIFSFCRQ